MNKYVALMRGINVGGNNKVEMKKLKLIFESLGYCNVSTYINSGNVIFDTEKEEGKLVIEIEKTLKKNFGFEIKCLIRDQENIIKINKKIPKEWKNDTEQKTDILFLWDEFQNKKTLELIATNPVVDNLLYIDGTIIWNVRRSDYTKSGMKKFIGTKVYKNMTARNVNTVLKLGEMMNK